MVTHTLNLCSAFNPSMCTHTAVALGGQLRVRCLAQGSHLSRGIKGGENARCSLLFTDNSCRTRDSNPQPQVTSQTLYPLGHDSPVLLYYMCLLMSLPFCLSNCHQTKFLVGANISGNKALSDSDSKIPQERCQKLVSGCATCFHKVIKAKGSFTKY